MTKMLYVTFVYVTPSNLNRVFGKSVHAVYVFSIWFTFLRPAERKEHEGYGEKLPCVTHSCLWRPCHCQKKNPTNHKMGNFEQLRTVYRIQLPRLIWTACCHFFVYVVLAVNRRNLGYKSKLRQIKWVKALHSSNHWVSLGFSVQRKDSKCSNQYPSSLDKLYDREVKD